MAGTDPANTAGPPSPPRPIPLVHAFRNLGEDGYRRFVTAWAVACLAIVPTGMLTRAFDWTGIPVSVGGVRAFVTIYVPLLVCYPLVLWFGYAWGAIPAYLATLGVSLMGGMALPWALLFAFANPLGLAAFYLGARSAPMRPDLRSLPSLVYFVLILFVGTLASSVGAFIWGYSNDLDFERFYPAWQGWWLGGFLQGVLLVAPILMLTTAAILRWRASLGLEIPTTEDRDRRALLAGSAVMVASVAAFALIARRFARSTLDGLLEANPQTGSIREELLDVFRSLSLPYWVMLTFVGVTLYLGYRIGRLWSERFGALVQTLEATNKELSQKTELLEQQNLELQRLAITDSLTQAHNRGYLMESLQREVSASSRHGEPLSVLLLDLDHFKQANDQHGHLVGDEILKNVADRIRNQLRREDLLARFGGEEFVVVLPRTDADAAWIVAEKIRLAISAAPFQVETIAIELTVSLGLACLSESTGDRPVRHLLSLADRALYRSKKEGRNRTTVASALSPGERTFAAQAPHGDSPSG